MGVRVQIVREASCRESVLVLTSVPNTIYPVLSTCAHTDETPTSPPPLARRRSLESMRRSRPDFQPSETSSQVLTTLLSGHALNKILKDIINRYRVSQGHRV